jgi:hypothetical protein
MPILAKEILNHGSIQHQNRLWFSLLRSFAEAKESRETISGQARKKRRQEIKQNLFCCRNI